MKKKVKEQFEGLKRGVLRLRGYARTFEEEVAVNSIQYMVQQAEKVFNNSSGGTKL